MADHIDGPRSIGDPSADISDLFAFTSPQNSARTVLAMDVFPSAGTDAMFSNVIIHAIAVRRVTVEGTGDAAKFKPAEQEIRFTCRFGVLEHGPQGAKPVQRGTCTLPGGQELRLLVNDEKGTATPDGVFRVFAGLRSDPFFLAWGGAGLHKMPNLLQHDNVLCIVIEFDTHRVLEPDKGSLFGVIGETIPLPQPSPIGREPPRIDWMGRPEQTNFRLNNAGLLGKDDLRDLWNQQTPFAIAEELRPLFLQRLKDSLQEWDMRDGRQDWTSTALEASANVFFGDFLLIDVAKPVTDTSHLEIEKSTINGHPYQTGGGRTVNANCIDIAITWMVNRDREFLQGGATGATKPGTNVFPYFASPNTELQTVAESIDLAATPSQVWAVIGPFGATWHPLIAAIRLTGTGVGQLRTIETIDGKQIVERLDATNNAGRSYRYSNISGLPVSDYTGTLDVKPKGGGSSVEWRAQFLANGQPDFVVHVIVSTLFKTGLASLQKRFGSPK